MTVAIGDLIARFRADTSDIERGGQVARQTLQGVEQQADVTSRALDIMAQQFAKLHGGTAQEALEMFRRSGAEPTASALAQAASQASRAAAALDQVGAASRRAASATQEVSRINVSPAFSALLDAQAREGERRLQLARRDQQRQFDQLTREQQTQSSGGGDLGAGNIARFAAGVVGVGLSLSLAYGTARLIHETIVGIVDAQTDWERSIVRLNVVYGNLGTQVQAISQAQANTPGLLGSSQEFAQANLAAAYLNRRYGLPIEDVSRLTSAAGAVSSAFSLDARGRADLQARALQAAESGGTALRPEGIELDAPVVAQRLGLGSENALGSFTPEQFRRAQALLATEGLQRVALTGDQSNQGLLSLQRQREQALAQAQSNLQNVLELPILGNERIGVSELGQYFERSTGRPLGTEEALRSNVTAAQAEVERGQQAILNQQQALAATTDELKKLGVEANTSTARLLSFSGSLEDVNSIARSDIASQAQGAVAARAQMAIPAFGRTQGEIVATAQNTAYQQAYQNFVAQLAQNEQSNPIREELERRVQFGPANQRPAAARALRQASEAEPIQQRLGEAQRTSALVDLQSQETQAGLERITLIQRERYVQLLRETVDLRRLDVQQQQQGLAAEMDVIRAQQSGLPAQYALSNAQYTVTRTSVLARARLARQLQGKDVSGLPSIEDLIQQNVQGQFAVAEAGPAALEAGRTIEVAQRTATSRGLAEQLTQGQLRSGELANDLRNLDDLPSQTALMLEDIQNSRDQLTVQREIRDLQKDLVRIFTDRAPSLTNGQGVQDIANRIAAAMFGDDQSSGNLPLPDMPGNRRGPF